MTSWPKYPSLYEINTWAWLTDLRRANAQHVTLADVPQAELERLASDGFDGIWLMGVWQRSPGARHVSRTNPNWLESYRQVLPDFRPEDVTGSPYAIADYRVDPELGGDQALAHLRQRLMDLGLRLILDFVPNHMALDHAWLHTHPSRMIQGNRADLRREPANYFETTSMGASRIFAHGRDPYFDGWPDTVQLDYRQPDTRQAMTDRLLSIAERCDGVRCDMAMLVSHDIFQRTWGGTFLPPRAEFWPAAITSLKAKVPDFLMMAEVYWDLEWDMMQQGFDYAYDKRLYDRLLHEDANAVRSHLHADLAYQGHLARFIENHDEERAATAFGIARSQAAALLSLTLPGLRLLHEGQLQGRLAKLPVHLGRRPPEDPVPGLESFYRRLLAALNHPIFHEGQWQLLEPQQATAGNSSYQHVVAHQWSYQESGRLIAVNLSEGPVQVILYPSMPPVDAPTWIFRDRMHDVDHMSAADQIQSHGLTLELEGYGFHLFEIHAT